MRVDESLKEKGITTATVIAETDFDQQLIVDRSHRTEVDFNPAEIQYRGLMNSILADFDGNATFSSVVTSEEPNVLDKTSEQTDEEDDNSNDEDEKDVVGKTPEEKIAENSTDTQENEEVTQ